MSDFDGTPQNRFSRATAYLKCEMCGKTKIKPTQIFYTCILELSTNLFLYPATLKSAGYYVIPSVQKFAFECPSVCPSVSASFQLSAGCIFKPIVFKLGMRVDIGKACPGIADG